MCLGVAASAAGARTKRGSRPRLVALGAPGPPGSGDAGGKCVRHVSQVAMELVSSVCYN